MTKIRCALIGLVAAFAVTMVAPMAYAQHEHHIGHDFAQTYEVKPGKAPHGTCRLGDFKCDHDYFHPIYLLLQKITGQSCCHDEEGRPTVDIEEATPEEKASNYHYRAYVDGKWCPFIDSALMRVSETQKATFLKYKKDNPELFYSFMEYDHAFAPKAAPGQCPSAIYCAYKKTMFW